MSLKKNKNRRPKSRVWKKIGLMMKNKKRENKKAPLIPNLWMSTLRKVSSMQSNWQKFNNNCQSTAEGSLWTLCFWQDLRESSSKLRILHSRKLVSSLKKWQKRNSSSINIQKIKRPKALKLQKSSGKMTSWKIMFQLSRKWEVDKKKKKFRPTARPSLNFLKLSI